MNALVGTQQLARALTDDERRRMAALLREHDYPGARLVALRHARRLRRGDHKEAQDLVGRAYERLVRSGWDPAKVSLVQCLCRFVWSEWTHVLEEAATARKGEEGFLREAIAAAPPRTSEDRILAGEERLDAQADIEELRSVFAKKRDEVNLLWLDYTLHEVDDLQEMARLSGRSVRDFYRAADRRKRHVLDLLAKKNSRTLPEAD